MQYRRKCVAGTPGYALYFAVGGECMNKQRLPVRLLVQLAITAVCITVATIVFRQSFFRVFPLYVSLVVGLLQAHVNRYSNLVGGCNAVLHGIVSLHYGLYGAAANSFLLAVPTQFISFINWSKNRQGQNPTLKKLTAKQFVIICVILLVVEVPFCWFMASNNSRYALLDSFAFLVGIVQNGLAMFRYKEYTIFLLIACINGVFLYLFMSFQMPEQVTYLIYAIYTLYCAILACRNAQKLYIQQQKGNSL